MSRYTQSILAANQAVAADGVQVFDLPVGPLSGLLIHLNPLQESGTITTHRFLEALFSAIDNINVTFRGSSVIALNGVDAAVLALLWHRFTIWQSNAVETNNERRSVVLPIMFGRSAFDVKECFPATKKGELQMSITWDIAATGQNEIDLPIGNFLRGVLMFGTTAFAGATPAPSLGRIELLKDNLQQFVSASDFEVMRGALGLKGIPFPPDFRHVHSVDAAGSAREDTLEPEVGASIDDNYALVDLDPLHDDSFGMETEGASRVHLRIEAETADAVRFIPIERVKSGVYLEAP